MMLLRRTAAFRRLVAAGSSSSRRCLSSEAYFKPSLFTPTREHGQLRDMVRAFTEKEVDPQAREFNEREQFNFPLFRKLGDLGLLGVTVDTEYGGSAMDPVACVIIHEELSASDPAFCLSYLAHSMLFTHNLFINGNTEQKHRFLPAACSGEKIGGMGMTEPWVGTDVLGMKTTAKKQGDKYVLNGAKLWITNGCVSNSELGDVFLVYARTGADAGAKAISLFLVEKGTPGFKLGQKIQGKCGMRASPTAELVFEDCAVPAANLVGTEGGAMKCMMRNLEIERLVLSAMSTGLARRCVEIMNKYAQERTAFGKPLSDFGQIQRHIADSYAEMQAARCYVYDTASKLNMMSGDGSRIDSDGVKLFASVVGKNIADRAMQTLGANGYVAEYQVERLWRDAKLIEIGGGTLEAHQKNMAKDLQRVSRLL